jgi:hypothetical protein
MILFATLLNLAILIDSSSSENLAEDNLFIEALREYNIQAQPIIWDSPDVNWADFDAALVFKTWNYHKKRFTFLYTLQKLEESGTKVYNSPEIIRWNSSKLYLKALEKLGLNPIESLYLSSNELDNLGSIILEKGWNDCVIKPQVSASSYHTYRFNRSNVAGIAEELKKYDEDYIVQPFANEVLTEGEWSFIFFNNEYSHCVLKKQLFFFLPKCTIIKSIEPPRSMIEEAQQIINRINLPSVKTRLDVIRRGNTLKIMEVEMIEPNLYMKTSPGAEKRLAKALSEKLNQNSLLQPKQKNISEKYVTFLLEFPNGG